MHFDAPPRPVRRSPQPSGKLRAALLSLAGGHATITDHREKNWASITFAGTRHRMELVFEGTEAIERAERFIADVAEHQFDIPGHLVADASVIEVDHQLEPPRMQICAEVLLLEDH